jgi:hypothetical protein
MSSLRLSVYRPPTSASAALRKMTFVPTQKAALKWFFPGQTSS